MKVVAVSVSAHKGVKKDNVPEIRVLLDQGVENDAHAGFDPKRQVSLLAQESIDIMKAQGLPELRPGDFAENITTSGLELHTLPLGAVFRIGPEAVLELSQIGKTCHHGCAIKQTTGSCIMPTQGIFGRVVKEGPIRPGDTIVIEPPAQ
ncbi:MAG: MOSC domain-containing protein [Candidatus Adiutrix sp.]|jgi:MOSC domain-containing protein YiiM|nr:MOSC domain-containing protein [Candidatus Adiutrix sp.]